jgi:hypothetical protein
MGQSTNAILFWGHCWDEERSAPWLDEGEEDAGDSDWEDRLATVRGIAPPRHGYPSTKDQSDEAQAIRTEFTAFWDAKRKAAEQSGCLVDSHCSGQCPMPYVAVAASRIVAARGYPEEVPSLVIGETWRPMLEAFCRDMGITPPDGQEPRWWLVSDWN